MEMFTIQDFSYEGFTIYVYFSIIQLFFNNLHSDIFSVNIMTSFEFNAYSLINENINKISLKISICFFFLLNFSFFKKHFYNIKN